ncbi:MAG: hypothetical protein NVSMB57_00570 [Actinomycetota bacterium]
MWNAVNFSAVSRIIRVRPEERGTVVRKLLGVAVIAMLAFGSFGVAHATPGGDCNDPADALCTTTDDDGQPADCDVYLNLGTPTDGCTLLLG